MDTVWTVHCSSTSLWLDLTNMLTTPPDSVLLLMTSLETALETTEPPLTPVPALVYSVLYDTSRALISSSESSVSSCRSTPLPTS